MKRTVKALQDLYVKLGGQLTDTYAGIADGIKVGLYKRIPDIIEAVKEKASGGGGGAGLPEVTAADNGDVLTVVEGAWAKAPSDGQNGWSVESTQLFSESVTTAEDQGDYFGSFAYNQLINSDTIKVTFNGTDYVCNRKSEEGFNYYGAPYGDFSVYPFSISSGISSGTLHNDIMTEVAGTYTVAVSAMSVVVSPDFAQAVAAAEPSHDFEIIPSTTTWAEAYSAFENKKNTYYFLSGTQKVVVLYVGNKNDMNVVMGVTADGNTVSYAMLSASSADGVLS